MSVRSRAAGDPVVLRVGGRELSVSRLDKVLWPATGFTKRDLIVYDLAVAPALLSHLRGRAVTLARFPDGVDAPFWFQSNCPAGKPDWLPVVSVRGARGQLLRYCRIEEPAALAWVAGTAAIELHPFLAAADDPGAPRALVLDLDPTPPAGLAACCRVALAARALLSAAGLESLVKTSGSKGLHVFVPLDGSEGFDATKAFAREVAQRLAAASAGEVTDRMMLADRVGKVLVDWRQNSPGLSTVAAYSLRGTPRPLVSTPLLWEEVELAARGRGPRLEFGPADVLARLSRFGDLFARALDGAQRLAATTPRAPLAGP